MKRTWVLTNIPIMLTACATTHDPFMHVTESVAVPKEIVREACEEIRRAAWQDGYRYEGARFLVLKSNPQDPQSPITLNGVECTYRSIISLDGSSMIVTDIKFENVRAGEKGMEKRQYLVDLLRHQAGVMNESQTTAETKTTDRTSTGAAP